ncbi:hypothetical protein C9F11_40960 [Streptomyces sp. YIM 121038]|uniref:hypothetical protein n=1 Tax=Streptomyces sp. YIM 121038 TaxID=2136401 RepID=UPI0011106144|nr:hypothetical protein [Streptomyces sp. YIM 121038]QCX81772.1 hypothetical protein C9F11_40960 [Streptomyces sp. YIM 121038]
MSGRQLRTRRGARYTGARGAGLCLLALVVCLLTVWGSGAASVSSGAEKTDHARTTGPYSPAVEASVGPDTSGCQDGDAQDAPRGAVLPRPDQPCAPVPRSAPTSGDAVPVATAPSPKGADATTVDLYRTRVIRT